MASVAGALCGSALHGNLNFKLSAREALRETFIARVARLDAQGALQDHGLDSRSAYLKHLFPLFLSSVSFIARVARLDARGALRCRSCER